MRGWRAVTLGTFQAILERKEREKEEEERAREELEKQRLQDIEEFRLKELERKRLRFEAAQAKATNSAETTKGKFHVHWKLSVYSAYAEQTDSSTQFNA